MKEYLILVAGGTGTRMGGALAKQFLPLLDRPTIVHTIESFLSYNPNLEICVVMHQDFLSHWAEVQVKYGIENIKSCGGGLERFHSVLNGLNALNAKEGIVGIHDAVRPLASKKTIAAAYKSAMENGSGVPVILLTESIRRVVGTENQAEDRSHFRTVQTPQCFGLEKLLEAYAVPYAPHFTDDASVWEASGNKIHLTEGNEENIKLTTSKDLPLAESILRLK